MEQVDTVVSKFDLEEELEEFDIEVEDEKKKRKKGGKKDKKKKEELIERPLVSTIKPAQPEPSLKISGLKNVKLSSLTQKIMGCIVGEQVTAESPWITISKVVVDENLYLHHESSDFLPVKDDLAEYAETSILVGYDSKYMPYEDEDLHRFYIAVTTEAKQEILTMLEKERLEVEEKIRNSIHKKILPWISYGSELEVDSARTLNSRPLISLELDTDIDELLKPVNFKDRNAEDAKDGYVRIGPGRHEFQGIKKMLVDVSTQAVPAVIHNTAQTDPGLPTNAWTQYLYDMKTAKDILATCQTKELNPDHNFAELDYMEKTLYYNKNFDLYVNDYPLLVLKPTDKEIPHKNDFEEYEAYADVNHCKSRLISSIAWHPMWSGIVALSYTFAVRCATASDIELAGDEVYRDVFSKNHVLLWSFVDALNPRLILESPREVHCLAWSPVNSNILVGGCSSGQIIIWDLKGKLEAVEKEEYLNPDQQRYRLVIQNLVGWLQPQPPAQYVRPAALSKIKFSHIGKVTHLQWLSPYFEWTKNGHYDRVPADEGKFSMQLISCGEDGVLRVWDLSIVPDEADDGKPKRRKIRKRPSALTAQISVYKVYDRKFQPIYILYPQLPSGKVSTKLTALSIHSHKISYQLSSSNIFLPEDEWDRDEKKDSRMKLLAEKSISNESLGLNDLEDVIRGEKKVMRKSTLRKISNMESEISCQEFDFKRGIFSDQSFKEESSRIGLTQRRIFNPILQIPKEEPKKVIEVVNDEGDFLTLRWEGFDFHKGEEITTEEGATLSFCESVHDGPVTTCARSPFVDDLVLTVGGKVIALWKEELKDHPLFWKYTTVGVTCGSWSPHRPCVFHIGRSDGSIEVWDLARSSDNPVFVQSISGKVLTSVADYTLPLLESKSLLGVGDYNKSFRLLYFPKELQIPLVNELLTLEDFIFREVYIRQTYYVWNESFMKTNAEELEKMKIKEQEAERIRKEAELEAEQEALLRAKLEEEEAKQLAKGRHGNSLSDRFLERLKNEREKQMQRVLMEKKHLNKNDLIAKQQPIIMMKKMEKGKKKKQKEKIKQQQKIFDKTVVMLFPEVIEKKEEGLSRIDAFETELMEHQSELMEQYDSLLPIQMKIVRDNQFNKRLKWEKVFEEGMTRRNVLDFPLYLRQKRMERFLSGNSENVIKKEEKKRVAFKDERDENRNKHIKEEKEEEGKEKEEEDEEEEEEEEEEDDEEEEEDEKDYEEEENDEEEEKNNETDIKSELALKAGYSWQTEGGTYLPGGAVAVAHQFLRCILHQLAPNGVFYQMFQTHVEESARTEFFRSVAQALIDFNELSPSVPLQLLLETLNAKKTLVPDIVVVICKNMSAYIENLPLEVGPVQPGSPWLTLLAQMELFFRRIVLLLPSIDNVLAPLAVMASVFRCPGISSCKSILEPFSKILSFIIQNVVVDLSTITEICQLCTRAFTRDREKQMLTRMLIIELVQALKFKTTLPDSNFLMLINFVIQDTGSCLVQTGFLPGACDIFATGVNAAEIMRQHLSDALDFLADFHTVSKIKSFCQGDSGGLNEDTLGGALKSGIAQYVALEMARGTRDNRAVARHLPWLYNAPTSLQQGPREFLECMGHVRLLSWLLLGGLFQSLTGHSPCIPVPPEASCHVADHIQVIFTGFAGQSKASVLHMSSLFHAFILCQLWTVYLETGANSNPPGSEPHTVHNNILLDFWGKVTPCVLQLVAHSKVLAEMVNLHFLSLLEALLEVNASILGKLMPLWSPVLFAHHVQLPGHLQMRLQNCRNFAPNNPPSNTLLAKWLQRLQFKMGQIELQSSAATQFYSV